MNTYAFLIPIVLANLEYEYMSRLRWYLPMSADANLKLTRSANHLIIENQNSIAGIKYEDGTYEYNSTFNEETACSAFNDDKLFTLSRNGYFGSWNAEDGAGIDWNKVIDDDVESCAIVFPSHDEYGFLVNQKYLVLTDISGNITWERREKELSNLWLDVITTENVITVVGRNESAFCWMDLATSDGKKLKELCKSAVMKNYFHVVGTNSDIIVWISKLDKVEGVHLPSGDYLDFKNSGNDMPDFQEASKTIIKIDSQDLPRSLFLVNYGVGRELLYTIDDGNSVPIISNLPLENSSHKNLYLIRDTNVDVNTIGRIYADDKNFNIFELIDPTTGEVLQQTVLEPVFKGRPIKGFLDTALTKEGYFTWSILGLDDGGAFFCHKPVYTEDGETASNEAANTNDEHSEEL